MTMKCVRMIPIIFLGLLLIAGCANPPDAPTPSPMPTATPAPTVPIVPTSTPNSQAPPTMKGVFAVDLLTADGVPLKGDYYRPLAKDAPGVTLIHGRGRTRSDWQLLGWQLMEQGFATLAIDLRGAGESGGQADAGERQQDVAAAVAFLQAQAEVNPKQLLLIGENDGSWWVLDYAAHHANIQAVALITPGIRANKTLLQKVMDAYGDRPIFIAVSDNPAIGDENAVQAARLLDELATGPHELVVLNDNAWGVGLLMQENGLAARLLGWMKQLSSP